MSSSLERALAALDLPPSWRVKVEVRPRRRTLGIEVTSDGSVLLAIPSVADEREVVELLRANTGRVARAVRLRTALSGEHPVKELVEGAHFAFLGAGYRLRLRDRSLEQVRLVGGWLELPAGDSVATTRQTIIDWYAEQGDLWCGEHITALADRAGIAAPLVTVRHLRGRWGERRPDGGINLHWAVTQLPAALIELVLAHELTHLKTARHSPAFREQLAVLVPGLELLERQLAATERTVWVGGVRGAVAQFT